MSGNVQTKKEECCGCTACYSICPSKAISMEEDSKGFLYPAIDNDICVHCGLCDKVCDFVRFEGVTDTIHCYAVKHKNEMEVASSRSGGIFIALSEYVLKQNGVVFGAQFETVKTVYHKKESDKIGVDRFKGSKYVQSAMNDCFMECYEELKKNRMVLFSGTACQIHGLKSYLEKKKMNLDKLLLVDIVCHGVPSPKLWRDFITETEIRMKKKVIKADFRDKNLFGWRAHMESFTFDDGSIVPMRRWTSLFYDHNMFRESCYSCPYTTPFRNSDITIADYWGIEKNAPEFDDDKGVSLVLIHSDKGKSCFEAIQDNIIFKETSLETSMQPNLIHPSNKGKEYDAFWKDFDNYSTRRFMGKWFYPSCIRIFIRKVKKLPLWISQRIK